MNPHIELVKKWQDELATGPDVISKRLDSIDACDHMYDETGHCFECDYPKPKFLDHFSDDLNKKIGQIYDILDDKSDDHSNNENLKEMIRLLLIMGQ